MKRAELLALADFAEHFSLASGDIGKLAAFARQIAEAQPVAWAATDESGAVVEALGMNQSRRFDTALYLAPPAREPLTNEQIEDCLPETISIAEDGWLRVTAQTFHDFARAVEQAHGIRSEK